MSSWEAMEGERWQRIREVFEETLEHATQERSAFLDQACTGDESLRREVESLLVADANEDTFLQDRRDPADGADPMLGRRIGPYQVERRLGSGGMGVVYLALRADEEFKQLVALKVLRPGVGQDVRRFRAERQILAALTHPNIAQLLDGGTTEDGLPYLVMEYIEGRPIDEYCEQEGLSIEARIELFRTVCSAVQFAHQNLVVHRDIKPGNILVSTDGTPKLLDFGIAKLLNPELSSPAMAPTATALRLMTPAYASPEQLLGAPISTASDVYSLGILLYELLTGRPPYPTTSLSPVEMMRVVCEEAPPPPSTAVPPERHKQRRRLVGDLDNIVLMALRKQPRRRYGSVEQLSEDLGRYLDDLPVTARKNSVFYRWGKLVRRNRWTAAASAAFVLACLGFAVIMGFQRVEIARERDRVAEERSRAERVTKFLIDLFEVADPGQAVGETLTARQILEMASLKLTAELEDQPRLRATLMDTIGMIHVRLGLFEQARSFLESALATRRRLLGEDHLEVAETLQHLAELTTWEGNYEQAEVLGRDALAMRRRLLGAEHPSVAESLQSLAWSLGMGQRFDKAEPLAQEALAMHRRLLGEDHPKVAESLDHLGSILFRGKGDLATAEALLRKGLAMRRQLLGDRHLDVAASLDSLSSLLFYRSELEEARLLNQEALAIRRQILNEEHPLVAASLNNLANVLTLQSELEEAEQLYLEALTISRKLWAEDHPSHGFFLAALGYVRFEMADYQKAEELFRESLALRRRLLGDIHSDIGITRTWLAEVLIQQGDFAAALTEAKGALEILRQVYAEEIWWINHAESALAACLIELGRYQEAERLLLNSYPKLRSRRDPLAARALARLVSLYEAWGRSDKAAEYRAMNDPPLQ